MRRSVVAAWLLLSACGPNVASIEVDPTTKTMTNAGETFIVRAKPIDDKGEVNKEAMFKLRYESSAPAIAEIAANGQVTARSTGNAEIVVKIGDVSTKIPVKVSIPDKLELNQGELRFEGIPETATITFTLKDKMGRDVPDRRPIWLSGDTEVATVQHGVITSEGVGKTEVTAKLGTLSAVVEIVVEFPPVAHIAVDPPVIEFEEITGAARLRPTAKSKKGEEILGMTFTFRSSDEEVVTVTEEGLVRGVSKGKATIEVEGGGKTISVPVHFPKK